MEEDKESQYLKDLVGKIFKGEEKKGIEKWIGDQSRRLNELKQTQLELLRMEKRGIKEMLVDLEKNIKAIEELLNELTKQLEQEDKKEQQVNYK